VFAQKASEATQERTARELWTNPEPGHGARAVHGVPQLPLRKLPLDSVILKATSQMPQERNSLSCESSTVGIPKSKEGKSKNAILVNFGL
jgi:hypothetical protein